MKSMKHLFNKDSPVRWICGIFEIVLALCGFAFLIGTLYNPHHIKIYMAEYIVALIIIIVSLIGSYITFKGIND